MVLFIGNKLNELRKYSDSYEMFFFNFRTHYKLKAYIPLVLCVLQQYSNIPYSKTRQK